MKKDKVKIGIPSPKQRLTRFTMDQEEKKHLKKWLDIGKKKTRKK